MALSQKLGERCITVHAQDPSAEPTLIRNWGWLLALGLVSVLLGSLAVMLPVVSSLTFAIYLGVLFLVLGITEVVQAMKTKKRGGFRWHLLGSVLAMVGGVVIIAFPFSGLVAITLFLGCLLLMRGVGHSLLAFAVKPTHGWGWLLFSGILSTLVALMILFRLPSSALWVIGLFVGIEIIFRGWAMIHFAFALRQVSQHKPLHLQPV